MSHAPRLAALVGLAEEAALLRAAGRAWPCAPRVAIGGGTAAGAADKAGSLLGGGGPDQRPAALLSFGYCGALAPDLRAGDLVIATEVVDTHGQRWTCDAGLQERLLAAAADQDLTARPGRLAVPEAAAATRRAKARLAQATGALAIDLESAAVARLAAEAELPFAVLRAVLDETATPLPPLALTAVDPETGRTRPRPLLLGLLASPGQLPALLRLGRARAAARASLRRLLARPLAL